jgi:hypothetical protein
MSETPPEPDSAERPTTRAGRPGARLGPKLNYGVIAPLALLGAALLGVLYFDFTTGGDAAPEPYLGALGSPVRGTFVPPTATPIGGGATPRPRPTFAGVLNGTPEERDQRRRNDLLILLDALGKHRAAQGSYPTTSGNVQTLCAYQDFDVGCDLAQYTGGEVPLDPLDDPVGAGYWYSSDGQTGRLYASLEVDVPAEQQCRTEDVELKKKFNLICVEFP